MRLDGLVEVFAKERPQADAGPSGRSKMIRDGKLRNCRVEVGGWGSGSDDRPEAGNTYRCGE